LFKFLRELGRLFAVAVGIMSLAIGVGFKVTRRRFDFAVIPGRE
jgi:hypothetical protein